MNIDFLKISPKNFLFGVSLVSFGSVTATFAQTEPISINSQITENQTTKIEGRILNEKGQPFSGVYVLVKGKQYTGTSSNNEGFFSLSIERNAILVFKSLGYKTQEVSTEGKTSFNITLIPETQQLDEVTVTSTGTKRQIKNFAGVVNIIGDTQIKELAIPTVGDAVRMVPGANYIDEDGRGLRPGIGFRGIDPSRNSSTLVLIDGKIPIGQSYADMGGYYMMPIGAVESVEVIKGASPVLYGSGSIGGVVNIITKKGSAEPKTNLNLQYGNGNALNFGVQTSGTSEGMKYYAGLHRKQGDGLRTSRSRFAINDITANLEGNFGEKNQWRIFFNTFTENSQTPGGLTQKQWEENPVQSVNPYDFFEARRFSGAISYKRIFDEKNSLTSSFYGSYLERDWWFDNRNADPTKRKFNGALRNIPTFGFFSDYERLNTLFSMKNKLLAGVRIHGDITNMVTVLGDKMGIAEGKQTSSVVNSISVLEGYVFDEFYLTDQFYITPAVRYTHAFYGAKNYSSGIWQNKTEKAFTYSFGAFYKFSDRYRAYATLSKGYQMPRYRDAMEASEDLNAESSNNYEIGIRTEPTDWLEFEVSGYILDFDNKIVRESGLLKNGVKSLHRGIELNAAIYPINGLKLYANAAIQKATFSNGTNEGNYLPYAPKYTTTAGVRYQFNIDEGQFTTNIYGSAVSMQYSDVKNTAVGSANGNIGAIPRYFVMNATINYDIKRWNFNVNALNLLNRKYFTTRHSSWGGIMPASTVSVMGGVGYQF